MKITMNDSRLTNIIQLREFLEGSQKLELTLENAGINEKYGFIDKTIDRLKYSRLSKKQKRVVIKYVKKITGYKQAQAYRLIKRAQLGKLKRKIYKRINPNRKYTSRDIKLLEKTDELHLRMSSLATKEIMRREWQLFGHREYANIAQVSARHINNLRESNIYRNSYVNHTKPTLIPIGETRKPENNDIPGSIRVDTVHQRDLYYINLVDEIIQWELVISVPQISEAYLMPALKYILEAFPFRIFNFHSDRGSEFINKKVAKLLNKLLVHQTKSRSRHTNDNALVEGKNGSVIRKNLGYSYFSKQLVTALNGWLIGYFNIYLNYHRPCLYQTDTITYPGGRQRAVYGQITTPYEKLKEISKLKKSNFLKPGITFEKLDIIAYKYSDNEFAQMMREAERQLFNSMPKS
jgi:transposase InsO family protein